ncbi:MAG: diguanylate cyclase [Clostridia bacterium]|nr:diguanylate cyclase [Clostridia bacterium]
MNFIVKHLFYAGLEKEKFDALKPEALRETRNNLKWYSLFAAIFFAVLVVCGLLFDSIASLNFWYYTFIAVFNAAVYLCVRRDGPKNDRFIMPLAYASVAALYATSIGLTLLHPELPAVTIIAVMLLTPFLFTDRPVYIIAMNITASAVLCLLSGIHKTRLIALDDAWNVISFCAVSIGAALTQRRLRFRTLSQESYIRYISEMDLLTGVYNRNTFERVSGDYPQRCKETLCCVYIDANGLHELNETKGHKAGDVMLQTVAKALLTAFGGEDVYRVGGDEFVVFRKDVSHWDVEQDMERVTAELSAQGYDISMGVASGEKDATDIQQMLNEAEQQMYRRKRLYYQQPGHDRRRR